MTRTSSSSCSAGGVLGREGATDSAARRPIVASERGKERVRSFPINIFREKVIRRLRKESRIPDQEWGTLSTSNTGDKFALHIRQSPPNGTHPSWCLRDDVPVKQLFLKVWIEVQVETEGSLLWSMIDTIRVCAKAVLWLLVGFRRDSRSCSGKD